MFSENQKKFLQQKYPYAQKAGDALGVPASFVLSQWAHESGFGTNTGSKYNNLAGIGAYSTSPYGKNGKKYATMDDFVYDYVNVLDKKRYSGIKSANTVTEFASALSKGGYAEDKNYPKAKTWTQVDSFVNGAKDAFSDSKPVASIDSLGTAISFTDMFNREKIEGVVMNASFVFVGVILGLIGIYFLFQDKANTVIKAVATDGTSLLKEGAKT